MDIVKNRKPSEVQLGDWTVWSLSDGYFNFDQRRLFDQDLKVLREALLKAKVSFSEDYLVSFQVNAYLIDTKEHLILVDTGCGSTMGPTSGFLLDQIKELGFSPSDISHVLITHLHGDHMGGLVDARGEKAFPNALLYVPAVDAVFWRDPTQKNKVPEFLHHLFDLAKKMLAPYEKSGQLKLINPEETILPGIEVMGAPGHTLGHVAYSFRSENKGLILWGDIIHVINMQLENLDWEVGVDTDPKQGVISRKKIVEDACEQMTLVGGGHLPGSGFGYVSRAADRFFWKPHA